MTLLDLLISPAYAQATGTPAPGGLFGGGLGGLLFPVILIGVMYFLMIRPQMKRAKEQKAMIESLQKGDEVVTAGGIVGKITKLTDQYATVEIAPNTEIVVQRSAVQVPLPKGTLKTLQ